MDKVKLAKIMAMTTSNTDPEALAALRMANKMLSGEKLTWGDILAEAPRGVRVSIIHEHQGEEWAPPHLKDKVIIDTMFRTVFAQPRSSNEEFWQFMESIHNQFREHGVLTQKQYQALRNCYNRAAKRG